MDAVAEIGAPEESSAVDAPAVENQDTSPDATEQKAESASENTTTEEKTETEKPTGKSHAQTEKTDGPTLPKSIAATLKAIAEDPTNPDAKSAAKTLKESFFAEQAYKQTFGSVSAAREAKALLSEIAGGSADLKTVREQWSTTKETLDAIAESDSLLYEGSPQVVENIVSDLKTENKLEALGKLAGHFLDAARKETPDAFVSLQRGLLIDSLYESGFPQGINALSAALKSGDITQAKSIVRDVVKWFTSEQSADDKRRATLQDQAKRQETKKRESESRYQTLQRETAKQSVSLSNVALGRELKAFLQTESGKSLARPALEELAHSIKAELYTRLETDETYEKTISKLLRTGNKEKALEYHSQTLKRLAKDVVEKVTKTRYPDRPRPVPAKKAPVPAKTNSAPVYVSERPKDLVRTRIVVNGKEYLPSDLEMLQIARGQGFVKGSNGQYRLVSWRKAA
jgi:hypothetical protein